MTNERKVQLSVTANAAGARKAFADVESDAKRMAQGVAQSGQQAAKGIEAIGAGAQAAAQKLTTAERSLVQSVERTNAALSAGLQVGERQSRAFYEALANQRGVRLDVLKPVLDQLDQLAAKQRAVQQQLQAENTKTAFVDNIRGEISALRERIALQNLSADAQLRYRAAQAGAGAEASHLITQLTAMRAAQDGLAESARKEAAAQKEASAAVANRQGFLEGLRGQADAIGKTRADMLELQAAQMGVSSQAAPYIARMRDAEKATTGVGVSAKQTAAALRGVPAQLTDIVVSLQAGQAPLTVLLQQGGQLKDMFGGIGPAARALGGYIAGLVGPFTLAAAGAAALGLAYYKGSQETDGYVRAIVLSGNAAGVTAGQMQLMARNIDGVVGTQAKAAEGLALMARSGAVGATNLEAYTQAAIRFEKTAGQALGDTVKQFEELRRAPLEASVKLNESMGQLTASTYKQIKALVDQGRETEAANLAQKTFADTLSSRATEIESSLGGIERGWRAIKGAIAEAGDAMLNIGRIAGPEAQLAATRTRIAELQGRGAAGFGATAGGAATGLPNGSGTQRELAVLREQEEAQAEVVRLARRSADERARSVALGKAQADWDKEGVKYLADGVKMQQALTQARNQGVAAGKSEAEIQERLAGVRAQFAKGQSSGIKDGFDAQIAKLEQVAALEQVIGRRRQDNISLQQQLGQISEADAIAQRGQIDVEGINREIELATAKLAVVGKTKDSLKEQAELEGRRAVLVEQRGAAEAKTQGELLLLQYRRTEAARSIINAERQQIQDEEASAYVAASKAREDAAKVVYDYAKAIDEVNDQTAFELGLMGRSERSRALAIEQRRIEIAQRRQLEGINDNLSFNETQRETERVKIREASARALAGAENKILLDEWQKTSEEINRSLTDALLRGFESGKGFAENLRDTVKNMFSTMVLRPVVSAVMQPVAGAWSSAITGVLGQGTMASGGNNVMGMAQNAQSLYNLYNKGGSYVNKIGSMLGWGGSSLGAGATTVGTAGELGAAFEAYMAAGGFAAAGGGAATVATAGELGAAFEAYMAANGTAAAVGAGGGAAAGAGAASAIPIIGWIIAGLMASNAMYGKGYSADGIDKGLALATPGAATSVYTTKLLKGIGLNDQWANTLSAAPLIDKFYDVLGISGGEKRFGGQYGYSMDGANVFNPRRGTTLAASGIGATFLEGPSGGQFAQDEVKKVINTTVTGINGLLGALESNARVTGFQAGLEVSANDRGGVFAGGTLTGGIAFGESGTGGMPWERTSTRSPDAKEALEQFSLDMQQATLQALQAATDIPKSIREQIKGLDVEKMTSEQIVGVLSELGEQVAVIGEFRDAIKQLPFDNLKALSYDTAESLIALAGGVDQLNANLTGYYENFYNEAERTAVLTGNVTKAITGLGLEMPNLTGGATSARAQFRALVEGLDVNTDKGREQYVSLLALQGAFAELTPLLDDATNAVRSQNDILAERKALERELLGLQGATVQLRARELAELDPTNRALKEQIWALQDQRTAAEAAAKALRESQDAALSGLQRAADAQREVLGNVANLAQESLAVAASLFEMLTGEIRSLRNESGPDQGVAQARQFVADAARSATLTGYLPDQDALASAVSIARAGLDPANYDSRADMERDQARLAYQLEQIQAAAGTQKSAAQQQLDAANAQIDQLSDMVDTANAQLDALRGIDTGVKTVADALAAFRATITGSPTPAPGGGGAPAGGSGAVFGGGGGTSQPAGGGRYNVVRGDGSGGAWYDPIIDKTWIDRLDALSAMYHSYDGSGDLVGLLTSIRGEGGTLADLAALSGLFEQDWIKAAASVGIPAFAGGGAHGGGWRIVGERGPEVEVVGPARYYSTAQTASMLGGGDTGALEARIDALTSVVEHQAVQLASISSSLAKVATAYGNGPVAVRIET